VTEANEMKTTIPITGGLPPSQIPAGNHAIDCHVGGRIFWRRIHLGLTREDVGERLGRYSAEQVRLWEDGYNRVTAAMLYRLSIALAMPVTEFFAGFPDADGPDGSGEAGFSGGANEGAGEPAQGAEPSRTPGQSS
jgi:transcriptional regulator with XRE-family HTH domain